MLEKIHQKLIEIVMWMKYSLEKEVVVRTTIQRAQGNTTLTSSNSKTATSITFLDQSDKNAKELSISTVYTLIKCIEAVPRLGDD